MVNDHFGKNKIKIIVTVVHSGAHEVGKAAHSGIDKTNKLGHRIGLNLIYRVFLCFNVLKSNKEI